MKSPDLVHGNEAASRPARPTGGRRYFLVYLLCILYFHLPTSLHLCDRSYEWQRTGAFGVFEIESDDEDRRAETFAPFSAKAAINTIVFFKLKH